MSGELISIFVAILWTGSAVFFEYAGRKLKAADLNLIRLVFAFILLGGILWVMSGSPLPQWADSKSWLWMSLSGFVGFVFGDFFLFSSYRIMPARFTQLIMTLAPLFAAVAGFFMLGEKLTITAAAGMIVTLSGIALSILKKGDSKASADALHGHSVQHQHHLHIEPLKLSIPPKGVIFALLASIGQGVGLVLSKQGMIFYEESAVASGASFSSMYIPLAATQIRIITGIVCFAVIILIMGETKGFFRSWKEKKSIAAAFGGSIVGPVIGVSLSLLAVQHANTAVASTLMALTPIIILIPDRILYKRRVTLVEVLGAVISVCGVAILTIF